MIVTYKNNKWNWQKIAGDFRRTTSEIGRTSECLCVVIGVLFVMILSRYKLSSNTKEKIVEETTEQWKLSHFRKSKGGN